MKLALLFAGALALFAQQPRVSNARLETRLVTGGLEAAFQAILTAQASPARGGPLLIQVARTNPSPPVRKQSVFWLGQSTDTRALAFIEDIPK